MKSVLEISSLTSKKVPPAKEELFFFYKKKIFTIEGVAKDGKLSKVQQAYVDEGAIQCGFCTPGLVLTTTSLVNSGKEYIDEEIKREISGHLCRCTGYQKIFKATKKSLQKK